MIVKCLAQEHNAVPRPGLEPGPLDPESSALTMRPPRLAPSVSFCRIKIIMFWYLRCLLVNFNEVSFSLYFLNPSIPPSFPLLRKRSHKLTKKSQIPLDILTTFKDWMKPYGKTGE